MTVGSFLCKEYFEGHMDSVSYRKHFLNNDKTVCAVCKSGVVNGRRQWYERMTTMTLYDRPIVVEMLSASVDGRGQVL